VPILPVWFDDPLEDYSPIGQWFDEQFDVAAGPTVYPLDVTTGSFTVGSSTLSSNLFFILNGLNTSYNLGSSSTSLLLTRRIDGSVLNLSLFQIPVEVIRRFPLNFQPSTFNLQGTGLDYFATRTLNAGSLELLVYVQTRDIVYRPNRQPFVPTPVPRGRNEWILGKFTSGGKGSFRV
jgi:hypothetical protein